MSYRDVKSVWSRIIKSTLPRQRARFPYSKGSTTAPKPNFVPAHCEWVNFLRKNESDVGNKLYICVDLWSYEQIIDPHVTL